MALLRLSLFVAATVAGFSAQAIGHEPGAERGPRPGQVKLPFVPPPMEGKLSLGIYDPAGQLVRVAAAMAEIEDPALEKDPDGLVAWWDGTDAAGQPLPAGPYRARGYCVGDLAIEGVACHGNDWLDEAEPGRVARLIGFDRDADGGPAVRVLDPAGTESVRSLSESRAGTPAAPVPSEQGAAPPDATPAPSAAALSVAIDPAGRLEIRRGPDGPTVRPMEGSPDRAIDASSGHGGTAWAVVETAGGRELRAYDGDGVFLRRMAGVTDGPPMSRVIASPARPEVFLIEEDSARQRLRGLRPGRAAAGVETGTSVWEEFFDRSIWFTPTLDSARALLVSPEGNAAEPGESTVTVRLVPNPLVRDAAESVGVRVVVGPEGSTLVSGDGLPLAEISSTPNLKWATTTRDPDHKRLIVFQSDGVVVEEFHVLRPSNMMAFDIGEIQLGL
jgi:hypothetical protein